MANTYKIISQSQTQEINPSGTGFMEMWSIGFKITSGPASGTNGTVLVTTEDHNVSAVKAAVDAKVADLSEIASLGQ
jgi:hypothetical protein